MGQPLVERIAELGLPVQPFTTTNASKAAIIQSLALAFETDEIGIPDHAPLISELQAFTSHRLPSGLRRYAAPGGMHDDCVISLALAWHGASAAPTGRLFA